MQTNSERLNDLGKQIRFGVFGCGNASNFIAGGFGVSIAGMAPTADPTKETEILGGHDQVEGTAPSNERYSRLAPLEIDIETRLALEARTFFSPMFQIAMPKPLRGQALTPASGKDFMDHLNRSQLLPDRSDRYLHQIRHLLFRMVESGLLIEMGTGHGDSYVMLPKSYYALSEISELRQQGVLWLAKALGGRFVHRQVSPAIVRVVGKINEGEGSGIVFDEHHVLTCRHVVSDMQVDPKQTFQGKTVTVEDVYRHKTQDVAVVRVRESLTTVPGLGFAAPMVSQKVFRFGYSRVPCSVPSSSGDSPLVMQSGEVTNESIRVYGGMERFLYSAISRPGDSGGAVVSDDGYVVGMTSELSDSKVKTTDGEDIFSPHYAGIPSHILVRAVEELGLGVRIPFETYE